MPVSTPGVYIDEDPGANHPITGVATSICAFVGSALRGPVDEPVRVNSYAAFERTFGGLWSQSGLGYAVQDFFLNGGETALIVRLATGDAAAAAVTEGWLPISAIGPGQWGNKLTVSVSHPAAGEATEIAAAQGVTEDELFHLTVVDAGTGREEQFLNVTVVKGPRSIDRALASSALVRVNGTPAGTRPAVDQQVATGGADGGVLTGTDYVGTGFEEAKQGIYALAKVELFTLLCLPPPVPAGDLPDDVWEPALTYCGRRRAFLLVDSPGAATLSTVRGWLADRNLTGDAARNGAVYFPRIRRPDSLRDGAVGDFAACGAVAGTIARTDAQRGVWKAPAGTEAGLAGASGLTETLSDADNGPLNSAGINCLRTFPGIGTVVWGARTLRGADALVDEYKYVPVRRMALYLEESLYRGTQWVVFEPNDEPLWAQIRLNVGAFMQNLFHQGVFQGNTAQQAYFVKCDSDIVTRDDIDRGIVNIMVGFAPLKPAEFIVIQIQQLAGKVDP